MHIIKRFHDAGVDRVIVRPPTVTTEQEMGRELEHLAAAVLR